MEKHTSGFTIIELMFVTFIFGLASILFFMQKQNIEVIARDETRKTAINAMYYSLEEVFYEKNKYYPQTINSETLSSVDPTLLKDINGVMVGTSGSEYTYFPTNCTANKCKSYTLKAILENEADYIKTSRNN